MEGHRGLDARLVSWSSSDMDETTPFQKERTSERARMMQSRSTSVQSSPSYWSRRSSRRMVPESPARSHSSFTTVSSTGSLGSRWNPIRCFRGIRSSVQEDNDEQYTSPYIPRSFAGKSSSASTKSIYSRSYNSTQAEPGVMQFTMNDIYKATRNFSPSCTIGKGGFGMVYKGRLANGQMVAIKRAKKAHDSHLSVEFQSEVKTLARVQHLNLVRFLGYFEQVDERIIVVEYVPNGTLREHLDGLNGSFLDLGVRLDVAIDVAHAVTYLHMYADHPIIHRDIKSSNILLTENFRAKVSDFGFARFGVTDVDATHVSTQVKGTAGYLDPEYLRTYQLTDKSDVYSFGVLLVELVTGRRPIESKRDIKERITARWAMKLFMEGDEIMTLDPRLQRNPATTKALVKILELARQCLSSTRQSRPNMRRCGEVLWSIRKEYRDFCAIPNLPAPDLLRHSSGEECKEQEMLTEYFEAPEKKTWTTEA